MLASIFLKDLTTQSGGMEIEDIKVRKVPVLDKGSMVLKTLSFTPHFLTDTDVSKFYCGCKKYVLKSNT